MMRGKVLTEWKMVFEEAASRLGGTVTGSRHEAPSLEATVDAIAVEVTVQEATKAPDKGVAIARASTTSAADGIRLYFGWDVKNLRRELEVIPRIPFPNAFGLVGAVMVRADDAAFASHFVEYAANDLADVRREAEAHGLETLLGQGTFRIAVHGIQRSPWMIERIVTAASRLVRGIDYYAGRMARPSTPAPSRDAQATFEDATCSLCAEPRKTGEAWVKCNRCRAPYHGKCWVQATGCLSVGCAETRATPM
jgi:hypothetical protein